MSSAAQPGPSVPKEEKEKTGIQKYVAKGITRMKTVLRKPADGAKRLSIIGSSKSKPARYVFEHTNRLLL